MLGSWNIEDMKSVNLPQKAASAFTAITGGLTGAEYMPVCYVGNQLVNGLNHCILCVQTLILPKPEKRVVKMIINVSSTGAVSLVSVSGIEI